MPVVFPLSKSRYVRGRQCLKYLWLYHHHPELADPISDFQEAIFRQGHEVGNLAQQLFSGGTLISADHTKPEEALNETRKAIAEGAKTLYEAAFTFRGALIRADILTRNADNSWHLIEVKSASSVRKDTKDRALKPQFVQDVAMQKWVIENSGLQVSQCSMLHLNSEFVRGADLNVHELFSLEQVDNDLSEELERVPEFSQAFTEALERTIPNEEIGSRCNNPYECQYKGTCWKDVGATSIHRLTRISEKKRTALRELNVDLIEDVPADFDLSDSQRIQLEAIKSGAAIHDRGKISTFLKTFSDPLYFLDFETIGYAIPRYSGTRPYQHLVFQYSLHFFDRSSLKHSEFFFERDGDPSRECAERLVKELGAHGSIVAYHKSFEGSRIRDLAARFTDLAPALEAIENRLVDLETPFSKFWYCDPRFEGRSSIKKVLPILVPNLSYANLEVQKGDEAQRAYLEFLGIREQKNSPNEIKRALLEYCKLDTLAMVEIYRELNRMFC